MRVGDKVRFLDDVGEGTIVNILDKKTVSVLNEYGFEVPVLIKELLVIETAVPKPVPVVEDYKEIVEEKESNSEEPILDKSIEINEVLFDEKPFIGDINIYIAFIPKNEERSEFDMFLINDSDFELLYTLSFQNDKDLLFIEANRLEDNTKIHTTILKADLLNEIKGFNFQAIPFITGTYKHKKTIDVTVPFSPVKLYKDNIFVENDFFDEDAFVVNILNDSYFKTKVEEISNNEIEKIKKLKELKENPLQKNIIVKEKKEFEKDIEEVDLHIHELTDKAEGLENGEKLQIQLDHFQAKLDEAIVSNKKRIVFIHGVGNGVLKIRLRNILDRQYKHLKYQDASFQQYGYGATIVFLHK